MADDKVNISTDANTTGTTPASDEWEGLDDMSPDDVREEMAKLPDDSTGERVVITTDLASLEEGYYDDNDTDSSSDDAGNTRSDTDNTSTTTPDTSTGSSADSLSGSSEGFATLLAGLATLCLGMSQLIDEFVPEATDEKFQELEETALKDTGITAKQIVEAADAAQDLFTRLSEILQDASDQISSGVSADSITTGTSGTGTEVSFDDHDAGVIDEEPDTEAAETTDSNNDTPADSPDRTGDKVNISTDASELSANAATDELTREARAADEENPRTTASDATHVPDNSPVAPTGPTRPAGDVINTPTTGPAQDILRSAAPAIRDTYPPVQINNATQAQIANELMGQNNAQGSQQPADTIHLTDQQVRVLSEAIAHNINLRREAAAQQMMEEYYSSMGFGGGMMDSFGGGGAGFHPTGLSNDYQEAILQLADQVVAANIPYAWGGGSLEGPSQGISDGGGYADACGDYNKIGFDCSGLVRYMFYQTTGVELPRVSQAQYEYCTPITDPAIGDIGFPGGGAPGHVYIFVGNGQIVEAQQSGTNIMFSAVPGDAVWGRPPESPNWG